MRVEPWQAPILVMAGIIVAEFLFGTALRRWGDAVVSRWLRTVALAGLTVLVLVVGIAALGPDLADQLASVAAAVATLVGLWLTYRSHQASTLDTGTVLAVPPPGTPRPVTAPEGDTPAGAAPPPS
ncbi:hypothetical protein BDK92_0058 [Micromonospora pisi]|uniref:Uncharacterized protein n=1 Tax=Micromonospora pisi TaxID=589240 RepID=A0A495JBG4_9ACTN|nr:hypothetical protein [Micromonospora pisi]RKR85848.1 hypothetical protein BDK92_0058 [Micromonospora pisi]